MNTPQRLVNIAWIVLRVHPEYSKSSTPFCDKMQPQNEFHLEPKSLFARSHNDTWVKDLMYQCDHTTKIFCYTFTMVYMHMIVNDVKLYATLVEVALDLSILTILQPSPSSLKELESSKENYSWWPCLINSCSFRRAVIYHEYIPLDQYSVHCQKMSRVVKFP